MKKLLFKTLFSALLISWAVNANASFNKDAAENPAPLLEQNTFDLLDISSDTTFFRETFEDTAASQNNWRIVNGTQTNKWWVDTAVAAQGRKSAYISNSGAAVAKQYNYMITSASWVHAYVDVTFPATFPTGTTQFALSFDWMCYGGRVPTGTTAGTNNDYMAVSLVPTTTSITNSTFTGIGNLRPALNVNPDWNREAIYLPDTCAGRTFRLVFTWRNSGTAALSSLKGTFPAAIDNIELGAFNCSAPTNFAMTSANADAVTFAWASSATSFELQYKKSNEEDIYYFSVPINNATTYTLTGLDLNTEYQFRLRSICGADIISAWTPIIRYNVKCNNVLQESDLPYFSNFETIPITEINPCWSSITEQGGGVGVVNSTTSFLSKYDGVASARSAGFNSPNCMALYQLVNNSAVMLISPPIDGNISTETLRTRFVAKQGNASATYLYMGIMTNPVDTSSFILMDSVNITSSSVWNSYVLEINPTLFPNTSHSTYYIAFKNNKRGNNSIYLDDLYLEKVPPCPDVTNLALVSKTSDTVILKYTSTAAQFNIEYREVGESTWTHSIVANNDTATIPGLERITSYEFRVQSVCGADLGYWSLPFTTMTNCGTMPLANPWIESFDNYTPSNSSFPLCMDGTNKNAKVFTTTSSASDNRVAHSTPNYAYFRHQNASNPCNDYIFAPVASLQAGTTYTFSFWYLPTNGVSNIWETLEVKVGSGQTAADMTTTVGTPITNIANATNTYQQYSVNYTPTTSGSYCFGIHAMSKQTSGPAAAYYLSIDDIQLRRVPLCVDIADFNALSTSENAANLRWSSSATGYSLEYRKQGESTWNIISLTTADTTYQLQGLDANSVYEARIQSVCPAGNGDYSTTISFLTRQTLASLPFSDDFEDASNFGWTFVNGNNTNKWVKGHAAYNSVGVNDTTACYISNDNGVSNTYTIVDGGIRYVHMYRDITFSDDEQFSLFFDWRSMGESGNDELRVRIVDTNVFPLVNVGPSSGIILGSVNSRNTWTTREEITITDQSVRNSTKRLVFTWVNNNMNGEQPPVAIDNILVEPRQCTNPTNLSFVKAAQDSLVVNWSSNDNNFIVEYKKTTDAAWIDALNVSDTFASIPYLDPNTQYQIRVKTDCGGIESGYSNTITARTLCAYMKLLDLPIYQGFEDATTPNLPDCWSKISSGASVVATGSLSNEGFNSQKYVKIHSESTNTILVSPPIDASVDTRDLRTRFWARTALTNGGTGNFLYVGLMTNPNDPSTLAVIDTIHITPTWTRYTVDFTNDFTYLNNHGMLYIVYKHSNIADGLRINDVYMDSISFELAPDCPEVLNIIPVSSTQNAITIQYQSPASTFNVSYRIADGVDTWHDDLTNISSTTATITGLTPYTDYEIRVRSTCNSTDVGFWSDPVLYKTAQTPAILPFIENFENTATYQWATVNGTQLNKWYLGTAVHSGTTGNHSVYISSDNGANNTYNIASPSVTHIYREIQFPQGEEFVLSFDWRCRGRMQGANQLDYLSVYLVDKDSMPVAGRKLEVAPIQGMDNLHGSSAWTRQTYSFTNNIAGTTKRLVFTWVNSTGASSNPPAAIDSVTLIAPACARPYHVNVSNVGLNSATFLWQNSAAGFAVEYKKDHDSIWTRLNNITDTFVVLNGLTNGTLYQARVRTNCSVSDSSSWSDVVKFSTLCGVRPLPYAEPLTYTQQLPFNPTCWQNKGGLFNAAGTTLNDTVINWHAKQFANVTGAPITPQMNISTYNNGWLISTEIDLGNTGTTQLEFDLALTKSANFTVTRDNPVAPDTGGIDDKFMVLVSSDGTWGSSNIVAEWNHAGSAGRKYDSISYAAAGERVLIPLTGKTGVVRIAFYGESTIANPIAGSPTIGTSNDISIKNVNLRAICLPVSNIQVTPNANGTAQVVWVPGSAGQNEWEVVCQQGTTTISTDTARSSSNFTLTGLSRDNTYTVSIRAICGAENNSNFVTSNTFTIPACEVVTNVIVSSQCATSAVVNFTAPSGQNKWELSYAPQAGGNAKDTVVTTASIALRNLESNTTYELRIRSICGDGDTGAYTNPVTIQTISCDTVKGLTAVRNDAGDSIFVSWLNNACQNNWQISIVPHGSPVGTPIDVTTYQGTNIKIDNPSADYDVYVRANCGNEIYSNWVMVVSQRTAIKNPNMPLIKVILAPNPARENTKLSIEGISGNVEMVLMTADGKVIKEERFLSQSDLKKDISLKGLAKGTYLIRLTHKDWTKVERLIIQ